MKIDFLNKVNRTKTCWLWTGCIDRLGYGRFQITKAYHAHRVAYELWVGPIPSGIHVLHTCDVRSCVNPHHLWLGTHADNMRDRENKGRANHPTGEFNGGSKLTLDQVKRIRLDTRFHRRIAEEYKVCRNTIHRIKHQLTWKII